MVKHLYKSQVVFFTVQRILSFGKYVPREERDIRIHLFNEYLLGTFHGFDTLLILWGTTENKMQSCRLESASAEGKSPGEGSPLKCSASINTKV